MKIALAQMCVFPGNPDLNFQTMRKMIASAKGRGCNIIAFPEMCIGGYLVGDKWLEDSWCNWLMEYNREICSLSDDIVIIYGNIFVCENNINQDGRVRKYNAGYAYYNRSPLSGNSNISPGVTVKTLLPDYRIFDDERYFYSMQELSFESGMPMEKLLIPFEVELEGRKIKIGVEICEDLWFKDYIYNRKPLNTTGMLIDNGADYVFNISASPWTFGKNKARNNRIKESYAESGSFVPFFYVNCVGVQNNGKNIVTFDGDSTVYNEKAEIIVTSSAPYSEELLIYDDTFSYNKIEKQEIPKVQSQYLAAIEGIKGLDDLMGNNSFPYIIGLSGGIDSSVVACLLERAVGSERIIGFNLPTKYNSEKTKDNASKIATKLKIPFHVLSIEEMSDVNAGLLSNFALSDLNSENMQAKIRGTSVLSNVAGIKGGVMTNNGNKVEIALGYATLYGDVNGAIAPIGDLLKTEVFEMAKYINSEIYGDEIIPECLLPDSDFKFKIAPSAELKANQTDPMKWGYHDALLMHMTTYRRVGAETFVEWYTKGIICEKLNIDMGLFIQYGLDDPSVFIQDLEWFVSNFQKGVFKRIQAPPIIIMSKGSFGYDIRESQLRCIYTNRYMKLKEQLLKS